MKIEHLRYFVEAVRCRSINKAAQKLHISQPTLSSIIKGLEDDLGFRLVDRSPKGIVLTEKGRQVFEDTEKILAMTQRWRGMSEQERAMAGAVDVTAVPSAMPLVLEAVSRLRQLYPALKVIIHDGKKANLLHLLEKGEAAVGIHGFLEEEGEAVRRFATTGGFALTPLAADRFCVFVNAQHPLAGQASVALADLKEVPVAIYAGEDPVAPSFVKYFKADACCYMNNLDAMMNFALHTPVAAVCTRLYAQHSPFVQQGLLKILEVEGFQVPFHYALLSPLAERITPLEAVVCDALRGAFEK